MEVACCRGLLQVVRNAASEASRNVPVKLVIVSIKGEILQEEWLHQSFLSTLAITAT
jgi:hypothetical protein